MTSGQRALTTRPIGRTAARHLPATPQTSMDPGGAALLAATGLKIVVHSAWYVHIGTGTVRLGHVLLDWYEPWQGLGHSAALIL